MHLLCQVLYLGVLQLDELFKLLDFELKNLDCFLQLLDGLIFLNYKLLVNAHSGELTLFPCKRVRMLAHGSSILFVVDRWCEGLLVAPIPGWLRGVFLRATSICKHGGFFRLTLLVACKVELKDSQDALDGIRHAIYSIFHILLGQSEAKLLEKLLIQSVPIVGLLRHRMSSTIVMKLHYMWNEMLHDLCDQNYKNIKGLIHIPPSEKSLAMLRLGLESGISSTQLYMICISSSESFGTSTIPVFSF